MASLSALLLIVAGLIGFAPAANAVAGQVDTSFANPNTNGVVYTMLRLSNGQYLVGGDFTEYAGESVTNLVRLNADGSYDSSFTTATIGGAVWTIAELPDQRIMIGGAFTTVDASIYPRIARLTADGALDMSFARTDLSGAGGNVNSILVLSDGSMFVGGWFDLYGSGPSATAANGLIKLNADGGRDASFTNVAFNSTEAVNQIQLYQGKLLVVGNFTTPANRVAVVSMTGTVDNAFTVPTINDTVRTAKVLPSGKIMIGGQFTTVGGSTYRQMARLNPDGTVDSSMADPAITGGTGGGLYSIIDTPEPSDSNLIIAGAFGSVGGRTTRDVAEVTADGAVVTSFADPQAADPSDPTSYSATLQTVISAGDGSGKLYVMGHLGHLGGQPYQMLGRLLGAVPAIANLSPASAVVDSTPAVTITGTGFVPGSTVAVDGTAATGVVVHSTTSITATLPASSSVRTATVSVTNANGTSVATDNFQYTAAPVPPAVLPGKPTVSSIAFDKTGQVRIATQPGSDNSTIQYRTRANKPGSAFGAWQSAAASTGFKLKLNVRKGRWIEIRGANSDGVSAPVKTLVKAVGTGGSAARTCATPTIRRLSYDSARRASVAISAPRRSCGSYRSAVSGTKFSKWHQLKRGSTSVKSRVLKTGKTGRIQIRAGSNLATIYLYYPQ